jgi:ferredoxin
MFKDMLDDLAARFSERIDITHVLSRDPGHPDELSGRIDGEKLERWLDHSLRPSTVDEWFLCGPGELVVLARETLLEHQIDSDHIHIELFSGFHDPTTSKRDYDPATVTVRCAGSEQILQLIPGDTILEAALQARTDVPYACMGGACGTCRAKLVSGTVEMEQNFALPRSDVNADYVLTCQSRPTSPTVTVDYDR